MSFTKRPVFFSKSAVMLFNHKAAAVLKATRDHFFCRNAADLGGQNASSDPWLKCGSSFLSKKRRRFSIQMAAHA